MRRIYKDYRRVRNMGPSLALGRRKNGRTRMRLQEWWVQCDSMSPSEAHRCVYWRSLGGGFG